MSSNTKPAASTSESWKVGDRVILHGLKAHEYLNGCHGVISVVDADNIYWIDFDLLGDTPRLRVRGNCMTREEPLPSNADEYRARVQNGVIEEEHGRAVSFILDQLKFLVGYVLMEDPEIQYITDIDRLKERDEDFLKLYHYQAMGWSHWKDCGSFTTTGGKSMYDSLVDWLGKQLVEGSNGGIENLGQYQLIYDSLEDTKGVKGWSVRIHGDFWLMGQDETDGSTLAIPDCNRKAVYKFCGMSSNLYNSTSRKYGTRPAKFKLTLVPWYGRLVYDGAVIQVDKEGHPSLFPCIAGPNLTGKLQKALARAQEQGLVVERLLQLEVPGGSIHGFNLQGEDSAEADKEQPEPTAEEAKLVQQLAGMTVLQNVPKESWTFRRVGYTEKENPEHMGNVIHASYIGGRGPPFRCNSLQPSSMDILTTMVSYARKCGGRPKMLGIDDKRCCARMEFLLKDLEGTNVYFYLPPSPEELASIANGDFHGLNFMS